MSERAAAVHFWVSRASVKKIMEFSIPPGYRLTAGIKRPKLDGFTGFIDQWLQEDLSRNRKQRHTAKRIFERLRDEHDFKGGYTTVKNYVREHGRRNGEMFVPLAHAPGHAQADFGEAMVVIGGVEQKVHFFALDFPHSDACFVRAYPAAVSEAWVDGHVHAFAFFGRVPQSALSCRSSVDLMLRCSFARPAIRASCSMFLGQMTATRDEADLAGCNGNGGIR
jgi:transposase